VFSFIQTSQRVHSDDDSIHEDNAASE